MAHDILNPGPHDALEKAREGEPVFLLLGRDAAAPKAIETWCAERRRAAREIEQPEKRRAELAQVSEAEAIAWDMQDYREGRESLIGRRVNYSDTVAEEPQSTEVAKLIRAVKHLSEAASHIQSGMELLAEISLLETNGRVDLESARDAVQYVRGRYAMKDGQRSYARLPTLEEIA